MAEKRERLEVVNDILKTIIDKNNKIGPTKLIRLSNLSPNMFKEYTNEMAKNRIIVEEIEKGKKYFKVTEKGFIFLEKYNIFKKFVNELGL